MGPDVKETSIFSFYNIKTKQSFAVYKILLLNKIKIIIENIPNSTAGGRRSASKKNMYEYFVLRRPRR